MTIVQTRPTTPGAVVEAVEAMRRGAKVPGLSIAVVDRERVLLAEGCGHADLAAGRPATAATAYLWFSMTKVVTATAAMRLVDEGRLDPAAPAGEYVDDLRVLGRDQPTVAQLLDHTAGLANPLPIRWAHPVGGPRPDPADLLRRLLARRSIARHPAGDRARYTNVGYLAAGEVIAAAAGMPFEAYVTRAVLEPLGMDGTGFDHPAVPTRLATGYVRAPRLADPLLRRLLPAGVAGERHGPYLGLRPFRVDGPAYGGVIGDVLDAARFMRMHLRDGELDGRRVLAPETARRMRAVNRRGAPYDHGIGWLRRPSTGRGNWVEHVGAGAGFWNVMRLYPDHGIGVVVMSNSTTGYEFEPLFAGFAAGRM